MKTLIASAPHADTFGYSMPPPGLLRLGGAVRDAGFDVELDDLSFRMASGDAAPSAAVSLAHAAAAHLKRRPAPDVFGLSVMGATVPIALAIMDLLRQDWRQATFLLGGPGMNGTDERVIERFSDVDVIVRGEGERTVPELLAALASGADLTGVAGLTLRDATGSARRTSERDQIRDLAELPNYAWDLLPPIERYKIVANETDGLVPIDSGRGCVYDCSFCSIGRTWRRRSRTLPAARLAAEIAAVAHMPRAKRAYLCHDIFGADRAHALALCDALEQQQVSVPWEVRARADHLDEELLARMARAGCDRVLLGIESASARVRSMHQKGMANDVDLGASVARCVDAGVTPILSLLLGLPGETDDELDETLSFCADAALVGGVQLSLHLVNPQPGCKLGETEGTVGATAAELGIPPDMALGTGDSPEERALIDAHPDLFTTWSHLAMPRETLDELAFFKEEITEVLMRFPRTFKTLRLAAEAREAGTRAIDIARRYRSDGRSFETFAAAQVRGLEPEALTMAVLEWESLIMRVGAAGPRRPRPGGWRVAATVFESDFDVATATQALKSGVLPERAPDALWFAVLSPAGNEAGLGRVKTLRITADVGRLLALDSERLDTLLSSPKGQSIALTLQEAGLVIAPIQQATAL